ATVISDRPRPKLAAEADGDKAPAPDAPNRRGWWFVPWAVLAVAAVPAVEAERLLRSGNDAFERGAFDEAVEWYTKAEDGATDPGRVAANKAAALYRLGRYREAELHYVRGLEDAAGPRRARLL